MSDLVNDVTYSLKPYPMEELKRIKNDLISNGAQVYDFGTGDPKIPTKKFIIDKLRGSIPQVSQYPSIKGTPSLREAQLGYMERRFGLAKDDGWDILPTRGSKEAIFHLALCLVGRQNKRTIILPDPGYPVYMSSVKFAGGIPHPVTLDKSNGYLLEPWKIDKDVISDCAAIWINYPYNPTGATAPNEYLKKVIEFCKKHDIVLLSDDCYNDIYDQSFDEKLKSGIDKRPPSPIFLSQEKVLTVMSLSKRSGMTGYRSGFLAGDSKIISLLTRARANMGLGNNDFISEASAAAWADDQHVLERRKIFTERMNLAFEILKEAKMIEKKPEAGFYLWCKIPDKYTNDDVRFAKELAERGVICSPSSWLSINSKGYVRFALVPELEDIKTALNIVKDYVANC